jgi:hypothetical protein
MNEREFLLQLIDEAYDHKAWHGPNLRGSLRGIDSDLAAFRPQPQRHNIWEIAVHAAYWKYVVRRRLTGEKRGSFPLKGSNWFSRTGDDGAGAWKADLKLLGEVHASLRDTVAALPLGRLHEIPDGSKLDHATLIRGIACHDVYHAGQVQSLKRLAVQHASSL